MLLDISPNTRVSVTGQSLPLDDFRVVEAVGYPDERALVGLLQGKLLAHHVRKAVDTQTCATLLSNFHRNPGLQFRSDEVPADRVGADHYGKPLNDYLDAAERAQPHLDELFRNTDNPIANLKLTTQMALAKYYPATLRAAAYGGQKAADTRAMIWRGNGKFTLAIHEDYSQTKHPLQRGFEIQQVETPVAVNFYPSVPRFGGGLRVWNLKPDDACRKRLGIEHTGYPYPLDGFKKIESMLIKVEVGDVVFLNGSFCHAVERGFGGERLLISYFMGFTEDENVVWWT